MTKATKSSCTRRTFLHGAGAVVAATALPSVVPAVHAAEDNTIQIAVIGCGGRGTGAVTNALAARNGPVKLVAMADVFADRLDISYRR